LLHIFTKLVQGVQLLYVSFFQYRGRKNLRHVNSSFYCDQDHFAHDPPGHTCGLPCCNSDLHIHMKVEGHHGGCIAIPFLQRKIIQDNFTLRNNQRGLLKGVPTFTSGFYSLQPERAPQRKPMPKFGTVRSQNEQIPKIQTTPQFQLDHELSQNQDHYIRGREITLPRFQSIGQESSPTSIHLNNFDFSESINDNVSDSNSEDSDTGYYTSIASIAKEEIENKNVTQRLIYPWDMLRASQSEAGGQTDKVRSEDTVYYDIETDVAYKKRLENVDIGKQMSASSCNETDRKTRSLVHTNKSNSNKDLDRKRTSKSLQRVNSFSYCTLTFDNNLFNKGIANKLIPPKCESEAKGTEIQSNETLYPQVFSNGNNLKCFGDTQKNLNANLTHSTEHPHGASEHCSGSIVRKRSNDSVGTHQDTILPTSDQTKTIISSKPRPPMKPKPCKQPHVPDSFVQVDIENRHRTTRKGNDYVSLIRTAMHKSDGHMPSENEGLYTQLTSSADNLTKPEVKDDSNKTVTFSIDGEMLRASKIPKCPPPPPLPPKRAPVKGQMSREYPHKKSNDFQSSRKTEKTHNGLGNLSNDLNFNDQTSTTDNVVRSSDISKHNNMTVAEKLNNLSQSDNIIAEKSSLSLKLRNIDVNKCERIGPESVTNDGVATQQTVAEKTLSPLQDEISRDQPDKIDNPITLIL